MNVIKKLTFIIFYTQVIMKLQNYLNLFDMFSEPEGRDHKGSLDEVEKGLI